MTVHAGRNSRPSARLLDRRLGQSNYVGLDICWGYGPRTTTSTVGAYNQKVGRYSNKRRALLKMREEGVPTPEIYLPGDRFYKPVIGRPDRHRAGRELYMCNSQAEVDRAVRRGVTHFLEYIEGGREFRVHVAFGKSIKIAEKVGGYGYVKNSKHDWYFAYPQGFNHKVSLREVAKKAVMSLELDFGAVDVIYKDRQYYVLEVNSAPCLTSQSDTLERYVKAFMEVSDV